MFIETRVKQQAKLDLSGSVAPFELPLPDMPAHIWRSPDLLRSRFHLEATRYFECEAVLAVTGIESGISALARLFQTWYGSMRVVLAEPSFDQWDKRFRRANHVVLDWPVDMILEGEIPECDVVVLGRPVNPTCQMISIQQVKLLARRLREQGGWLILDEAYLDWTSEESYASFIEAEPAIVLRSVAPFSGLAGANLAFVCGPKAVCTALLNEVGTQAVSSPQWWLALQYFEAEEWRAAQIDRLAQVSLRLETLWRSKLGAELVVHRGGYFASFVHEQNEAWANQLEAKGVLVRVYQSDHGSILRCGIPKNEFDWMRLSQAIHELTI
ncbi:aminotransferase class I/II-fold pyridoxal phosphate-dependent enzyme [Limnobacter parvus]|uniref:Aminotransferase class I/II-fold pyridoxal phosphate-dependent enzyme n=1 Tax=Limnobacter parvus TaxID=2939690 RepID=A0ABT1XH16_9BURK|nr:aminotransferase class I/II-fold pyridoxal phosphate-dependent enzyme [Limnobacter parvus]MCR2746591.1 aminotransferase class I/II-fold pyridoxal phosphate-dependent enzyme [Limnobacter parvus]